MNRPRYDQEDYDSYLHSPSVSPSKQDRQENYDNYRRNYEINNHNRMNTHNDTHDDHHYNHHNDHNYDVHEYQKDRYREMYLNERLNQAPTLDSGVISIKTLGPIIVLIASLVANWFLLQADISKFRSNVELYNVNSSNELRELKRDISRDKEKLKLMKRMLDESNSQLSVLNSAITRLLSEKRINKD